MNNLVISNLWRFFGTVAAQVLIFRHLGTAVGAYFNIHIYPMFILLLPIKIPTSVALLLGFLCGLVVDFFYGTIGVHASAGAFAGYARSFVFGAFEPNGGFSGKEPIYAPHYFGMQSFLQVSGVFLLLHLFWYFSVEQFTLVYFGTISLKTLAAWGLSMIFAFFYILLFNPKQ